MLELAPGPDGALRCSWGVSAEEYLSYHDNEWGFPVDEEARLFEKLCLEGFQSGLSWITVLRKRPAFREVFAGFDIEKVALMGPGDVERLLGDPRIIRHRGKIEATINNAQRALEIIDDEGSLASFVWRFEPAHRDPGRSTSPESVAMSRELKRRGFRFVGPTTAYAFMQAMGLVNDHLDGCISHPAVEEARALFSRPA
ncbi:MAG: DNA-3-methyladenine glycosylase I [Actinobacteria bacterium]|nr:MAG: DNA-3-methyladenine glycosylase I [Actinomycetota bacterium]REK37064.1 MAG: DNA-3-methyladenine glycosylase I [Actinomycetota bacterium]